MLRRREYGLCLSMVAICFPNMTILMLVWCIWLSVCVSGSDLPPFPVGGLDLPVGTGNPSWCIVCVCQRTPPLAVRYYELWRSEWLRDIRVDTVLQMQHVVDRVELAELGGCVQVHIGNGMFKWVWHVSCHGSKWRIRMWGWGDRQQRTEVGW